MEQSCRWTRAELEQQQSVRLTALRRFALRQSPFYQRFHHGLDGASLERLPILTKAAMMEHFDELVTDRDIRLSDAEQFLSSSRDDLFNGRYVVLLTSGSTGRRGVFLFDWREWIDALAMITRPMAWAGVARSVRTPPRSAVIASTTPWHYSTRISASLTSRFLPSLRLDAAESLATMVSRLNEWQPEILAVYPSVLKQLADEQIAGRLRIPLRSIATSAEVLPADTRRRVHDAWGLPVFDTYGATEYAPIAAECSYGRKHLLEDGAIIEVVDDRGRRARAGERGARLLLTIFNRRTQPLIRYEISDMVRPLDGGCECGRPFALIESIEGRVEDVLLLPSLDARSRPVPIHPNVFHDLLERVPATGWQVRQLEDGIAVSLLGLQDRSLCKPLAEAVRRRLESQGAFAAEVRVSAVDALHRGPTGKAPLVIAYPVASS